jgi:protein gp37
MAHRLAGVPGTVYARVREATGDEFAPAWHTDMYDRSLRELRRRRTPSRVFVGSMGDMCFDGVATYFDRAGNGDGNVVTASVQKWTADFAREVPKHTVLVLTKRPDLLVRDVSWPENVHLGVSVTGNADAGRIADLHRWYGHAEANGPWNANKPGVLWASVEPLLDASFDPTCLAGLDWVVAGTDSSPGAKRVAMATAVERIVAWCHDNRVPVWCKASAQALTTAGFPQELP